MRTSICFSTGYAPLALLTGRDFVTPSQVALNGEEEIGDLEEQIAQDDANEKTSANEDLEYEEIVSTYRRICDPKLPFFIEDTEDWGPPKRTVARKRTPDDMDAFEAVRANAKAMRMDAAANAEKKMAANKKYYDAKHCQSALPIGPGSKILVRNSQFTTRMHGRLGYRYSGPFVVLSICKKSGVTTYGNDGKKLKCSRINAKLYAERQKYTATADAQKTTGKRSTASEE